MTNRDSREISGQAQRQREKIVSLLNAISSMSSDMEAIGSSFSRKASSGDGFSKYMDNFTGNNNSDKFLSSLKQKGIDPDRFLSDLQSEGIDPDKFLSDLNRGGVTPDQFVSSYNYKSGSLGNLSLDEVAEKMASLGGADVKRFISGNDSVVSGILSKNNMTLKSEDITDSAFSFMKGGSSVMRDLSAALDSAKASLPDTFKKQLGQSLMAMGQTANTANSMKMGADLMGVQNGVDALKGLLGTMKAELSVLQLDKKALPALGELMAESGMDNDTINNMLSQLASGSMTMEQVFYNLNKASSDLSTTGSLVATEDGMAGLGQFFSSLGVSPEVVESIVSGFKNGDNITSAALKDIIGSADESLLSAPISEADAENLGNCLKAMGASDRQLGSLANLLSQTDGKMSVNDFVNFFDKMGPANDASVSSKELDLIKTIMANISREQELAKTPVFDETLTKLQALGDQEIDDDFMKMSPALQALRGGISGSNPESNFGGQMGQNGQQGQQHDQQSKEQYRQAMHSAAQMTDTSTATSVEVSETVQSYGGQESLTRQISQKILYSHQKGIHRLKMKLNPEAMGKLDIELKVKGGELTAHITAESRETYEALAGEIDELKDALAAAGVKLGNMTLSFDDQESGSREFADLGLRGPSRKNDVPEIDPAVISEAARSSLHEGALNRII
ncbi:hypothetical protein C4J81_12815 [Deltaproteobacteria bacterium Smac51]|nr:hypothetical protein C4J81_12815 [Deltaproteobacteria bacterium Smac51]